MTSQKLVDLHMPQDSQECWRLEWQDSNIHVYDFPSDQRLHCAIKIHISKVISILVEFDDFVVPDSFCVKST